MVIENITIPTQHIYLQTSLNASNFAQFKIFRVQEQTLNSDAANATLSH